MLVELTLVYSIKNVILFYHGLESTMTLGLACCWVWVFVVVSFDTRPQCFGLALHVVYCIVKAKRNFKSCNSLPHVVMNHVDSPSSKTWNQVKTKCSHFAVIVFSVFFHGRSLSRRSDGRNGGYFLQVRFHRSQVQLNIYSIGD